MAHGCPELRFLWPRGGRAAPGLYEHLGAVDVTARDGWHVWAIEGAATTCLAWK